MNNNDILRRLRYAFDFSDKKATNLFKIGSNSTIEISQAQFNQLITKEDDKDFVECTDPQLAAFLDGIIIDRRGAREPKAGEKSAPPIERISKNDILKKLRIALNYKEQDMLDALRIGGSNLSKGELSAFFRKPGHKHYRQCGDQALRNFIKGITTILRPTNTLDEPKVNLKTEK